MSVHRADESTATATAPGRNTKALALAVIAISQLIVVLDVSIVNIALPSMQRALDFSVTNLEWIVNAYALAFGGLLLLGGRLADTFGPRRILMVGLVLLTLSSLLGGLATTQGWLIGARAAQGVAGALVAPAALVLLARTFAEGTERARAMGVYAAMSGAGGALGNVLGGVFTDTLSWRWVLYVNVPIAVAALIATPLAFRESATVRTRLDLPGALTGTAGISLIVYGLIHAATDDWGSRGTVLPLVGGVALLVLFVVIEAVSRSPLMPLKIFANRNRSATYLVMLALGAGLIVTFYFLTLFMQLILHYSPLKTGFTFLTFAAGAAVTSGISGQLVTRIGARPLVGLGTLLSAGSLLWLSRLSPDSTYVDSLLGPLVLFGAGVGLCFVPLTLAAVAGVRNDETGVPSALLNTSQQIGAALGLAVLGTIAATATKDRVNELMPGAGGGGDMHDVDPATLPPEVLTALNDGLTHGYATAFLIAGLVMVAAFVLSLVITVDAAEAAERSGTVA